MSSQVTSYKLEPWLDLSKVLGDSVLQSLSIGYEGDLYALVVDPPYEFRKDGAGYPMISRIGNAKTLSYSIIWIDDQEIKRVTIDGQGPRYRFAQPLPGDELLAVAPRAREYEEDIDNGHIFSKDGVFLRGIALSDAIESVQTTADGDIWVGYFDEAIGNHVQGIAKWGSNGKKRYQCWDRDVFDCYALNVTAQRETWFYYYTDFELVHLKNDHEVNYWEVPVPGSHAFALWQQRALFEAGYDHHNEYFVLLELKENHQMKELARYAFVDGADQPICPQVVTMRGELVVLLQGTALYRLFAYELSG